METEITVALIVAFASLAGSVFMYFKGAKKDDVEALRGIISELKAYISDLERDKEDLQTWAELLVCQVKEAGMVPARFVRGAQTKKGKDD